MSLARVISRMDLALHDDSIRLVDGAYVRCGVSYVRVSSLLSVRWPFQGTGTVHSQLGTDMHAAIDDYLGSGVRVLDTPELSYLYSFLDDNPALRCVGHEFPVFSIAACVAGTCDALFYDMESSEFILVDWKRSRALFPSSAERYQMQLSIYKALIMERYRVNVDRAMLVLLHPDNDGYRAIVVPLVDPSKFMRDSLAAIGLPTLLSQIASIE